MKSTCNRIRANCYHHRQRNAARARVGQIHPPSWLHHQRELRRGDCAHKFVTKKIRFVNAIPVFLKAMLDRHIPR
ncbi:Uncharacterised protein [Vibrio cholerae]|nr:Uncharacterised protein [Vibrio cholerae]